MPYIKQENRSKYFDHAQAIAKEATVAGDLNYAITEMVHAYIRKKGVSYAVLNEVIGALECSKIELYRRQVAGYEDTCIEKNGDTTSIYPELQNIPKVDVCPEPVIPNRNGGGESH